MCTLLAAPASVATIKLPACPRTRLHSARLALPLGAGALVLLGVAWSASTPLPPAADASAKEQAALLDKYCSRCHNDERLSGNLTFSDLSAGDLAKGANLERWEKI